MAKSTVDVSDVTIRDLDPLSTNKVDTHQVCFREVIPFCFVSSNLISQSRKPLQVILRETPFSKQLGSLSGISLTPAQLRI